MDKLEAIKRLRDELSRLLNWAYSEHPAAQYSNILSLAKEALDATKEFEESTWQEKWNGYARKMGVTTSLKPNWTVTDEGALKDMNAQQIDKQYPLIEKWLELEPQVTSSSNRKSIWADDLERCLEKGVQVYGHVKEGSPNWWGPYEHNRFDDTHTALLIGQRPIKQKTREEMALELLGELVDLGDWHSQTPQKSIYDRARKLLERES